jgi:RimJ/RimL family protein N-acetyltransferase
MIPFQPNQLRQFADVLRLRTGAAMTVRFVEPGDVERLRSYFQALSKDTHYSRFLGAASDLPQSEYERMLHTGEGSHFAVVAEIGSADQKAIVGEARYAFNDEAQGVEFGISVADDWHGTGAGFALLSNLECRAAALGAERIYGDALRANKAMLGLARKRGYQFTHPQGDWTLVRFVKDIRIAQDIPCVQSSRAVTLLAAAG